MASKEARDLAIKQASEAVRTGPVWLRRASVSCAVGETARRVALQHTISQRADDLLRGDDLMRGWDAHEWVTALTAALGDIAVDLRSNHGLNVQGCVVELGALVQVWLEAQAREDAR